MGHRFFDEPLLGAELTVQAAMGHSGRLGQSVHADAGDAALPHQPGGSLENPFAVFGRLFF